MAKLIIALLILPISCCVWAKEYILEIHNQTQQDLHYIYVSNVQDQTWEEDLLDENEFLEHDGQLSLTLTDYDSPYFDIRAIDAQGDFYYRYRVNAQTDRVYFKAQDRIINSSLPKIIPNSK